MATQSPLYLSGEAPGTLKANQETEAALERLLQNLEARQKKMFDPELLALAQGFLSPTKTGSFGESLGYAAGNLREAQQKSLEEQQKLDETRISLATKRMELERQRQREKAFEQLAGGEPQAVAPSTGPVGAGEVAAQVAGAAPGRLTQGVKIGPGDPSFPTREQFLRMQRLNPSVTPDQAVQKWQELVKGADVVTEGGVYNRGTGMFFPKPGGAPVQRKIFDQTYEVSAVDAARLDMAQGTDQYRAVAQQVLQGMSGQGGAAPRSVTQTEVEKAAALERERTLAAESAKMEANAPQMRDTAMQIRAATDRIRQDLQAAPEVFGVFEKPGVVAAFGRLIDEGLAIGTTRVNMGGFRQAVTQALPGMTQDKLDALMRFAGNKAELELLFRRKYLGGQGQGAISNMEQAMIPNMIGSEKDTPQSLNDKSRLLSMRAQFDLKEHELWRQMSRTNRGLTYLQFRNSDEYERIVSEYDQALRQAFNRSAAPASAASTAAPASGSGQAAPVRSSSPVPSAPVVTPVPSGTARPPVVIPQRIQRDESLPMPEAPRGAPFPGALRRLESLFPPSR